MFIECKIDIKEEDYISQFKPDLMDVTYEWCKGRSFMDICKMSEIFEGSIIRTFKWVEEVLKQLKLVASSKLENHDLKDKFDQAMEKLKRGIVFSASLYI